jgi:hypothetical protein
MKKQLSYAAFACVLGTAALPSRASVLVEPVVGWTWGQHLKLDKGENYNTGTGVSYGGRLGWQSSFGLQLGLDYLKSSIDMGSNDFKKNVDEQQYAAFVGFKFPVLFRAYAGYIFDSKATTNLNNANFKLDNGTGWKLGVDCTILPFLDLLLEYRQGSYDGKTAGVNTNTDFRALMLGVSLPFTLF